ncbi:MAG TPA: type II toxin-antitoxin system HicB family antitoxin [Pyrinomonadaceae bacterium]|nr:type II toxin-antitoxin system HicB family antitoxin [Pyrinomonadaceae bacterium]
METHCSLLTAYRSLLTNLHKTQGEDGFVVAEVPSLPGCISQGKTREEALDNVREAISLHAEVLRERGEPLPEDKVELVEVAA